MDILKFLKKSPVVRENIKVAFKSIKSNKLRSTLTILMIAVGITSLLGILTATEALKHRVNESFASIGAQSFFIRSDFRSSGERTGRIRNNSQINFFQATSFKESFSPSIPCVVTIYSRLNGTAIKRGEKSTSPNSNVFIADEDYIDFNSYNVAKGRALITKDILNAAYVCVIGNSIASTLFDSKEQVINANININGASYLVVGVLEKSSAGGMMGGIDQSVIIPVSNGRSRFSANSFTVGIRPKAYQTAMQNLYDEAESAFRSIRRLTPEDETDFNISYNETMANSANSTMSTITLIAGIIGLITLLGASIGLMNIMLVSVKERTSEIGTRKALGASSGIIKQQFLVESITIAQIGCLIGIVLGVAAGAGVAALMQASFVMPWFWIIVAVLICVAVGMASGYLPAKNAAALDPIEALRYE